MVQANNPPLGSFLPPAVHQTENRRPAQWRTFSGRRQPRLFPAQDADLSRQQQLLSRQTHPVFPQNRKEGKCAFPSGAAGYFIEPVQVDDEVELAAQQQGIGNNQGLLRLLYALGS